MTTENDGIVAGPAFVAYESSDEGLATEVTPFVTISSDEGFATEVTPLVTISSAEYRELCGKAALWDSYSADVERWATGGDE